MSSLKLHLCKWDLLWAFWNGLHGYFKDLNNCRAVRGMQSSTGLVNCAVSSRGNVSRAVQLELATILLMIEVLHDLIYQNPTTHGSIVYNRVMQGLYHQQKLDVQ